MPVNVISKPLKIQFGLLNHADLYLTAETFGFKVNASAPTMTKKQLWTMEHADPDGQVILLRSHLGRYLATNKAGEVVCEAEVPSSDCRFLILAQPDSRWALLSEPFQRYLGGSADRISCFAQTMAEAELWTIHLALHPQASLLSVSRKRYARLSGQDAITFDSDIPWGVDSLITLVFMERKYGLKTCDNRFLSSSGKLVKEFGPEASFTLDLRSSKLAFRDNNGKYLTPTGPPGTLKSGRNTKPGKDELFDLEESNPQVVFLGANKRYVSERQGVGILANQDDETDLETFQMEIDQQSKKYLFRSNTGNYWELVNHGGLQTTATEIGPNTLFDIEWLGRRIALKASNGKYVCTKKNGQLAAVSDNIGDDEQFVMKLINRPILILRGQTGFVAHHKTSNALDVNRSVHDIFLLLFNDGAYHIKCGNDKYWYITSTGTVGADNDTPEDFFLEFLGHGRVGIKSQNGKYMRSDQGGMMKCDATKADASCLWEF